MIAGSGSETFKRYAGMVACICRKNLEPRVDIGRIVERDGDEVQSPGR